MGCVKCGVCKMYGCFILEPTFFIWSQHNVMWLTDSFDNISLSLFCCGCSICLEGLTRNKSHHEQEDEEVCTGGFEGLSHSEFTEVQDGMMSLWLMSVLLNSNACFVYVAFPYSVYFFCTSIANYIML